MEVNCTLTHHSDKYHLSKNIQSLTARSIEDTLSTQLVNAPLYGSACCMRATIFPLLAIAQSPNLKFSIANLN